MAALILNVGERRGRALAVSSPDWEACGLLTSDPKAMPQVPYLVGRPCSLSLEALGNTVA